MTRLEQKASKLQKLFPGIDGIKVATSETGVNYISLGNAAEGGWIKDATARKLDKEWMRDYGHPIDAQGFTMPAADYYAEAGYQIHPALDKACKGMGLMIDWYDPGTIGAYLDN